MRRIKTIALYVNPVKVSAAEAIQKTIQLAREYNVELITAHPYPLMPKRIKKVSERILFKRTDLLMAFGGDGTIISAARALKGMPIPLLGVNLGGLGFLTAVSEKAIEKVIPAVLNNKFRISERTMLDVKVVRANKVISSFTALNDAVVEHGATPRIVHLALEVEAHHVTSYACDGLIISTPTGSTGHSLSAGGPILHPKTNAFVISVICPHTLSVRPLVLPDSKKLTISIIKSTGEVILAVDGQIALTLKKEDKVQIQKSAAVTYLVQMMDYNYFEVLQEKLHWSGSALPT